MSGRRQPGITTRLATPEDAAVMLATTVPAFEAFRAFAPPGWEPPRIPDAVERTAEALAREDVWCLLAFEGAEPAGHVALSPQTMVDPEPPPRGVFNVWQLFVRPPWQGTGVATLLMDAALAEARRRGFRSLRLWTPEGQARARRFYERSGWRATGHEHLDSLGLPLVNYEIEL